MRRTARARLEKTTSSFSFPSLAIHFVMLFVVVSTSPVSRLCSRRQEMASHNHLCPLLLFLTLPPLPWRRHRRAQNSVFLKRFSYVCFQATTDLKPRGHHRRKMRITKRRETAHKCRWMLLFYIKKSQSHPCWKEREREGKHRGGGRFSIFRETNLLFSPQYHSGGGDSPSPLLSASRTT